VPIDGLTPMAEEIIVQKKERKFNQETPFTKIDESSSEDEPGMAVDSQKAQKKLLKKERREKRRLKKELKLAFANQNAKN
jgi:hypothetical protein